MEEEKRSYRWLWAVIPAIVAVIALAICLKIFWPQTTKVPDHVVNISGSMPSPSKTSSKRPGPCRIRR